MSTSAVPMIVRDPPSSMFLAEPKNFFGRMSAFESTPPVPIFPEAWHSIVVTASKPSNRVHEDDNIRRQIRPCASLFPSPFLQLVCAGLPLRQMYLQQLQQSLV